MVDFLQKNGLLCMLTLAVILAAYCKTLTFQDSPSSTAILTSQSTKEAPTLDGRLLHKLPSPNLSPTEVIAIQLGALQHNDPSDNGIQIAFYFASPANQSATGPLEQFKKLIKKPLYADLLNFRTHQILKVAATASKAQVWVMIKNHSGEEIAYLFTLSKQTNTNYRNCWMTDSVIRMEWQHPVQI